ncbi:hydantoinase/oxoprolinase family protein [Oceanibaculum pacificum]|uniref:Hydantoinase n=1 Tax=Oceanibaculum pacificum TaxID=580166 RepID=A0A154W666_9PROT|nr:hydantoinase/oxoprolinase family protein [Oceanibaculum pacificum]KZD08977.1 hydantoinase [Oceanibaculum pacificum]
MPDSTPERLNIQPQQPAGKMVGVDVGGTFTDLILIDPTGGLRIAKVPTTVQNQAYGVMSAIEKTGAHLADIASIVHGTTTTTNALLERKIATCGLITTRGFRDILELGRRTRPKPYGLIGSFEPLIARENRLEVAERTDAYGHILTPLDEEGVRNAARALLDQGVEALVIHFLHAYANPAHERRAAEIVREIWPNPYVTIGSDILSEFREYERGTTASVNAAIQPVLDRYIRRLTDELSGKGYANELLVMQGNGGTVSARIVAEAAVNTVMSGPASGVMAAAYTARLAGYPEVITYDMGGTSSDVGLILGGVPAVSAELELEYALPIHVPMVDVHTIGAGGGSLARIDEAGLLQVGPESAGATPGPICYGRGGARPTITDANLALGRLNPAGLLAVDAPVSIDDVKRAISEQVGDKLGLDTDQAAAAILAIGNMKMANAIRMVSLARGHDPRDFALFAFGGAGPLHAVALARELAIPKVLIPARPGITNALGCVVADLRHDYVNTVNTPLAAVDMDQVATILREQVAAGRETIAREGTEIEEITVLHDADMQFQGQTHILTIPVPGPDVGREYLEDAFAKAYWERFEVELPEIRPVLVNLHTAVIGRRPAVPLTALIDKAQQAATPAEAVTARRAVWFAEGDWQETPIYRREKLPLGGRFEGPAIVEQLDTTIVIEPNCAVDVDDLGNLIVTVRSI